MKQSNSNTLKGRKKDGQIAKARPQSHTPIGPRKITSMPRDKKNGERSPMLGTSFQEQSKMTRKNKRGASPRIGEREVKNTSRCS